MPHSATQSASGEARDRVSSARRKRDHRATVQAQKLRMELAAAAIAHGDSTPSAPARSYRILLGSAALAAVILVITIGAAAIIQML